MSHTAQPSTVEFEQLGLIPYGEALDLQFKLRDRLIENRPDSGPCGYLLLLEHTPVVTIGKRGSEDDLIDTEWLSKAKVDVHEIERGGELTYHGPGQLVVYPVFDLKRFSFGVVDLIRGIANCIAGLLETYSLEGSYDPDVPGVWLDSTTLPRKIASVGMRVQSDITTHGAAFNINNDMTGFNKIVACGMPDASMARLADFCPDVKLPQIQRQFLHTFRERFELDLTQSTRL